MANWLNIAGGAAQGYNQGVEDDRRRQEFNSLQRQRARVEKEQKTDDELAAEIKGIRGPGEHEDPTPSAADVAAGVKVGPPSAVKKTKVTQGDYDRAVANATSRTGRLRDVQAGAAMRAGADAADERERLAHSAKVTDTLMQAARMNAAGDHVGAARLLQQAYKTVPDGNELVIEDRNGVPHYGVAAGGKYAQAPQPITPDAVNKMIAEGLQFTSPDMMVKMRQLQQGDRTAAVHERQAATGEVNAATTGRLADNTIGKTTWETTGPGGVADLTLKAAMARHHDASAGAAGAAAKKQTPLEKAKELVDYYTPLIMQANPGMSEATARQHAAQVALRDPNAKTPDVGIAEQGLFRLRDQPGKLFRLGKSGEPEEVLMPADIKTLAGDIAKNLPPKDKSGVAPVAAPAAPAEDPNKKYHRSQVRGGYNYTPVMRGGGGKTKAEWAAEDAQLGIKK